MEDQLFEIENKYQVKVLYACEAGSRAWGLASENSDYDVRFIYVHPVEWYLDIDQKRDVIEQPITHSLDLSGWDLRKALFLLRKSNPPLFEWLHSDITYMENDSFCYGIKNLAMKAFSSKACIFHYLNMAKRNAKDIFQKENIKIKQYLTILRPLLACKWIETNDSFPLIHFPNLVKETVKDDCLKNEIERLVYLKIKEQEYIDVQHTSLINEYIKIELLHLEEYVNTILNKRCDITEELNQFFRKTLNEAW